jgi:hypothetical protein
MVAAVLLLIVMLSANPTSAQQNGVNCSSTLASEFPFYNFGWRIHEGTIQQYLGHPNVLGSNGTSMLNPLQTRVAAYIDFSDPVKVVSIRGAYFSGLNNPNHFTKFEVTTSDNKSGASIANGFGWWDATVYMPQNQTTRITLSVVRTGTQPVALTVTEICYGTPTSPDTTGTATPSRTPTISPTPTSTVLPGTPNPPTWTPSPTAVPPSITPSITPGGPTNTPGGSTPVTGTPAAIAPPQKIEPCQDTDDCGEPLVVPNFAPINLPSPTAMTQAAFLPTSTFYVLSGTGTPGTPTATGTPAPIENDVISYATKIADTGNAIGTGGTGGAGFGIDGENGFAVDIQNGGNEIGSYIGVLFGAARSVQAWFLGKTGSIMGFLLLIIGFYLVVKLLLWAYPIIKTLFSFFLQVISTVRQFFSL